MTFIGLSAQPGLDDTSDVHGNLTVRDTTSPVTPSSRFLGAVLDASGTPRVAFQADAAISCSAFGLLADLAKETGGVLIGTDVRIEIDAEATLVSARGR